MMMMVVNACIDGCVQDVVFVMCMMVSLGVVVCGGVSDGVFDVVHGGLS